MKKLIIAAVMLTATTSIIASSTKISLNFKTLAQATQYCAIEKSIQLKDGDHTGSVWFEAFNSTGDEYSNPMDAGKIEMPAAGTSFKLIKHRYTDFNGASHYDYGTLQNQNISCYYTYKGVSGAKQITNIENGAPI